MAPPDLYTIDGEKLQLGQIIKRCEKIAERNKDGKRYFVGREAIRGRLRCGIRTWEGLTAKIKSQRDRVANHRWRSLGKDSRKSHKGVSGVNQDMGVYEPEDYVGPDEAVDKYG